MPEQPAFRLISRQRVQSDRAGFKVCTERHLERIPQQAGLSEERRASCT
jgi:hypothetical protein